jgi:DtxR family Mn-dependent transcriptional regulator
MESDGLIHRDSRKNIVLTDTGKSRAEVVLRRHRLAERMLIELLDLDWIAAHEQAHHLEHAFTPSVEERVDAVLDHPATCPHGNPIPGGVRDASQYLREAGAFRLSDAPAAEQLEVMCISEVVEDETAVLRYVGDKGLRPGTPLKVREREPGGAISVEVRGRTVVLGLDLASKIWARSVEDVPDSANGPAGQAVTHRDPHV